MKSNFSLITFFSLRVYPTPTRSFNVSLHVTSDYARVVRFPRALQSLELHQLADMKFFVKCGHSETPLNFLGFVPLFVIFFN